MKLSVSAYRAHASAHKKILDTAYQLNYGSTSAFHPHSTSSSGSCGNIGATSGFQIEPPPQENLQVNETSLGHRDGNISSDDANTPLQSPRSQNTSREEDDSSNANESEKSPNKGSITKSNQRWMKLRTTVQISSAIQKKPPLKREDSFLQRFSTRQIPEAQETVEDTGSEGNAGEQSSSAPRRRRRTRKQPNSVVNPDENFYFHWLLVITICVLYNMWTLIVRQSFPELQSMISSFWLGCDALSDIVFIFDVVVQLRTGYLEQGLMVYDSKKLACHYLRSRAFLLDIASLCPLDLLQFKFGTHPLLRCPRFLKVYRAVNYYYMVESRTVWPNLWRVINLIHILLILAHWFGCFYFLLSEAEGFQGDWVYPYRPGDYATLTRKYLGSLYWSTLTLTTIGDLPTPETNAEYIFTIVSYLIGVFIFATIVGQVGNVITNRNANRLEFERLLDGAKTYMRHHKVPGGMKRRVLRWYDYSWSRGRIQGGGDINTALGLLPDKLKTELALHVNLSVLKKVTIFQECQPEFLRDLVLKMKAYIFTPGDSICRKGEVAREMFIIADGILEVISENGKVLTTMKAGDFFGEIGILNLDGLNKRTADVRSVGYSELFSLSREDVLAAMKDYPEAQEILQALGRKRLMEVKASARMATHKEHHHHHHHHHHSSSHGGNVASSTDPKGLVDKIKNEAKGIRNALKKSKTHNRRSQESLELQPICNVTNNNKSNLKRMSRVKSHDLSQEDDAKKENGESTSPLGAGLPLLHRLRLLKEKQDNEERSKCGHTPPLLSPASVKSPSPISEETVQQEPIGSGLPLLQRILMLKAKEEKLAKTKERERKDQRRSSSRGMVITGSQPTSPSPTSPKFEGRASFSGVLSRVTSNNMTKGLISTNRINNNKISLRERLKLHSSAKDNSAKLSLLINSKDNNGDRNVPIKIMSPKSSTTQATSSDMRHYDLSQNENVHEQIPSKDDTNTNKQINKGLMPTSDSVGSVGGEPHWSKLKKAAIGGSEPSTSALPLESVKEHPPPYKKMKPKLNFTNKNKQYRSIDDLSPEYSGLPFVKKLKILNERQKLEELETVIKTRSFSLDIPDNQQSMETDNLIRSQSEGCRMHHKDKHHLTTPMIAPSPLHSSTESNETPERRNLKSILKKLSEDVLQQTSSPERTNITTTEISKSPNTMPEKIDSTEFKKLMRAPTIEGYAARHSKLSKSVTFNRDTLQSPPDGEDSSILVSPNQIIPITDNKIENGVKETLNQDEGKIDNENGNQLMANKGNQVKLIKANLDDEHRYFADILLVIKQVMSAHLQEMQEKFHHRFERLEDEIKNKEQIINKLKAHIFELEKNTEDSFTDSIETIVGREPSWEDPTNEEREEIDELAHHPLSPHPTWSQRRRRSSSITTENVVLNIDSTSTDTDSELGDSSDRNVIDGDDVGTIGDGEYQNSSSNWEIELLAAQIRQKRSASLDTNIGKPVRKRFLRGASDDAY